MPLKEVSQHNLLSEQPDQYLLRLVSSLICEFSTLVLIFRLVSP